MPENEVGLISRILSGSVIVFAGSLVNKFISFVGSIFIARTLGESGYGVVVVSLSVYFILTDALNLGLPAGVARNYPQAESDEERRGILVSSFVLGMSAGFVGGVVVFVSAHPISVHVFNDQSVAPVLQIIGLLIPLKVLFALSNGSIRAI
jgi:O-antigen/teichoic acid export membrane protein